MKYTHEWIDDDSHDGCYAVYANGTELARCDTEFDAAIIVNALTLASRYVVTTKINTSDSMTYLIHRGNSTHVKATCNDEEIAAIICDALNKKDK